METPARWPDELIPVEEHPVPEDRYESAQWARELLIRRDWMATIRALVALSIALIAVAFMPDPTSAATDCNLQRDLVRADLSTCNLRGRDFSGLNLSGANLTGAYMVGVNLTNANLSGADLSDATLAGAYLRGADLSNADLHHADIFRADLTNASLTNASLVDADLTEAFRRRGVSRADMNGAIGLDTVKGLID